MKERTPQKPLPFFISTQCKKGNVQPLEDAARSLGLKVDRRAPGEELSSDKIVSKGHIGVVVEVNDFDQVFDFWKAVNSIRNAQKHA